MARQLIYYRRAVSSLEPQFDECGEFCPNENAHRPDFCDSCPHREAKENFEQFSIESLDAHPQTKDEWRKYGFEAFYKTLLEIIELEDSPRTNLTVKTHCLIGAWKSEKHRAERIDEYNRRPSEKQ